MKWKRARAELLIREKAPTRAGDELAADRRRLPMTRIEPLLVAGPPAGHPSNDLAIRRVLCDSDTILSPTDPSAIVKFTMPREPAFRLVAIGTDGTRVVLGTHLTEAQAKAIVELLSQRAVTTRIVVERDGE
jgi:hypothetical protein